MNKKLLIFLLIIIIIIFSIGIILLLNRKANTNTSNVYDENDVKQQEGDANMSNANTVSNNILFDFMNRTVKLSSGYDMPILGLGTWTQDDEETAKSVYSALEDGYRLIDTAQYYGNETGVGNGLKKSNK